MAKADEGRTRAYVVLGNTEGDWYELGTVEAANTTAAIRGVMDVLGLEGVHLAVAVSARSWHPVAVALETTTRLRLTDVLELDPVPGSSAEGEAA